MGAEQVGNMAHTVRLEGRHALFVSGVTDVQSFDETQILLETVCGMLLVRGQELHIEQLQLEAGELTVTGEIGLLEYGEEQSAKTGFWARLFGG